MANLKDILFGVKLKAITGKRDREIGGLTFDSRKVRPGDLFVAIQGLNSDGHDHLEEAVAQGVAREVPLASRHTQPGRQEERSGAKAGEDEKGDSGIKSRRSIR